MIRFQVIRGPLEGQEFEFEARGDRLVLGRSSDADVSLGDALCSREHASVELDGDHYLIQDLDSTNGVQVNGRPVRKGEITYGDRIALGKSVLVFLGDVLATPEAQSGGDEDLEGPVIEKTQSLTAFADQLERMWTDTKAPEGKSDSTAEEHRQVSRQMKAMYSLSRMISTTLELDDLYLKLADALFEHFAHVDRVVLFASTRLSKELQVVRSVSKVKGPESPVSRSVLKRVVQDRVGIIAKDVLEDERFDESQTLYQMRVRSMMCVPLIYGTDVLGAIYVENCDRANCFSQSDLEMLTVLGGQAAMAMKNAQLYVDLQVSFYDTIKSLGNALEAKDRYTRGHSVRVALYAVGIGSQMGLSSRRLETLRVAAELHDIGKIAITEAIINKERALTDEEFERIKQHPELGVRILEPIGLLKSALPIILHHHERYNGEGYPHGLVGTEIPLEARILNLADAFDAMTTQRAYNTPRTFGEAVERCRVEAGVSFDADCVEALVRYLESHYDLSTGVARVESVVGAAG